MQDVKMTDPSAVYAYPYKHSNIPSSAVVFLSFHNCPCVCFMSALSVLVKLCLFLLTFDE